MKRSIDFSVIVMGLCVCAVNHADAAGPPTCILRLTVELAPDVTNPSDPASVSSRLRNHVGYRLPLMRQIDDTTIDAQFDRPGTVVRCQEVVEGIREDGRIQSIDVLEDT